MERDNCKWKVDAPLQDFDAVSLYPSAFARLYTVQGIPSVLQPSECNYAFVKEKSAYVVDIEIQGGVAIILHFPLIAQTSLDKTRLNNDEGGLKYINI